MSLGFETIYFQCFSYVIIYEKGYQDTQKPYSSVTTKVKGVSSTNLTPELNDSFPLYNGIHVWDSADYIVPPEVQFNLDFLCYFCLSWFSIPVLFL